MPSHSVVSNSLSMGLSQQVYGVSCHFLLQGNLLTQGLNPCLLKLLYWRVDFSPLSLLRSPLLKHMGSSSPTSYRTWAPCIGNTDSQPLDHQGSPKKILEKDKCQKENENRVIQKRIEWERILAKVIQTFDLRPESRNQLSRDISVKIPGGETTQCKNPEAGKKYWQVSARLEQRGSISSFSIFFLPSVPEPTVGTIYSSCLNGNLILFAFKFLFVSGSLRELMS